MWPDDYIDWALRSRPATLQAIEHALEVLLARAAPQVRANIFGLTSRAVYETFRQANAHRQHPDYFADETAFRRWLFIVALYEALGRWLRQQRVRRALNLLPADQRRLLGMLYLDRLTTADIASILGISADEVSRQRHAALDALCQLL